MRPSDRPTTKTCPADLAQPDNPVLLARAKPALTLLSSSAT